MFLTIRPTAQNIHHGPTPAPFPLPPSQPRSTLHITMALSFASSALFALTLAACAPRACAQNTTGYDFFDHIDPLIGTVNGGKHLPSKGLITLLTP